MYSATSTTAGRIVAAAGALTMSALLLAPQHFAATASALLSATHESSARWVLAVRAGGSGAREVDIAVVRPGRQV